MMHRRRFAGLLAVASGFVLAPVAVSATARANEIPLDSARWIWKDAAAATDAPKETLFFRHTFTFDVAPQRAEVIATCDNRFTLFINGREVLGSDNWEVPVRADIARFLTAGKNVLAVRARNDGSAAGFFLAGRAEVEGGVRVDLSTHASWRWHASGASGWNRIGFDDAAYQPAVELGDAAVATWRLDEKVGNAVTPDLPRGADYWRAWRARQQAELATLEPVDGPPADRGADNPVDAFLYAAWKKAGTDSPPRCSDRAFARRVYLDIIGLLPPVDVLDRFETDPATDKRARLVDDLLGRDLAYAEHWMSFWNDLLRNDEQTAIDGLRKPITPWLFDALLANLPYDQFVATLLNPGSFGPDGYLMGLNWRGTVSASQRPVIQAAQNVGQVFMAVRLKCASCHDSFIDDWTLRDAYGLAGFFSEKNLTIYECDKARDEVVEPRFPFPKLGGIEPTADLAARHQRVSELVTTVRNRRFAETIVNRIWHRFTGRAFVVPMDSFGENDPTYPKLLAWLADDFARNGYDLKQLMRRVTASHAYQAETTETPEQKSEQKADPGPPLRRLTAEQFIDGVATVTGYWPETAVMSAVVDNNQTRAWRQKIPDALARALGRPAREQAITEREDEATVLQMLEMVNGTELSVRLEKSAQTLLASSLGREKDTAGVVDVLCRRAMGRVATPAEIDVLQPLLGTPDEPIEARQPGWQDALWLIFMNPEFQFIY